MKLVLDMNLSPALCDTLAAHGFEVVHWSKVGSMTAPDRELMGWARAEGFVVLTHDLDFGILLALTGAGSPSVVQVRTQDVTPQHLVPLLVPVLRQHERALAAGAIITVDEAQARVRLLPL